MARGQTLLKLLDDLRAECRLSPNPAHNAQQREGQVRLLQRMQEWLYDDHDWPHLQVERFFPGQHGQRYYALPSDIALERILHLEVRFGMRWLPISSGIDSDCYAAIDSDGGQQGWPVRRWRIWEDDRIELWPVPDQDTPATGVQDGSVKVVGIRNLRPFRDDTDVCDLDDRLIVLYAAAETLSASGAKDAPLKLQQAAARYAKLKGDLAPRRRVHMFQERPDRAPLRGMPMIDYRPASK
ncbi:phage adaptor protein [Methylobacterium fujisawaense]